MPLVARIHVMRSSRIYSLLSKRWTEQKRQFSDHWRLRLWNPSLLLPTPMEIRPSGLYLMQQQEWTFIEYLQFVPSSIGSAHKTTRLQLLAQDTFLQQENPLQAFGPTCESFKLFKTEAFRIYSILPLIDYNVLAENLLCPDPAIESASSCLQMLQLSPIL